MSDPATEAREEAALSRRKVMRYGVTAAAVVAWSAPTVASWRPTAAHAAVSPPPAEARREPAPTAALPGELPVTGFNLWTAATAGVAAAAAGTAAVRYARAAESDAAATTDGQRTASPDDDRP